MLGSDALLYFGHGLSGALGDPTTLIDASNYADYAGKELIAIACDSGRKFGKEVVSKGGAHVFLGFDDILTVYTGQASIFGAAVESALLWLGPPKTTMKTVHRTLVREFKDIENRYRSGSDSSHHDAAIIWMGAHINWRGVVLHP